MGASRRAHHTQRGPSLGITSSCRNLSRARDDPLGCFAFERSQQALHDGVLRWPELFGALFSEATENCQCGQMGLGRQRPTPDGQFYGNILDEAMRWLQRNFAGRLARSS